MSPTRLLLYAFALALFSLLPASALAHPASGIVVDARGRIHFSDLETGVQTEIDDGDECEKNAERVENALGLYFGLGIVAIGAVSWLKHYRGRTGHA